MIDVRRLSDTLSTGAVSIGAADLSRPVDTGADEAFRAWLADGCHAAMDYLPRHADLRADPRTLLPGARAIIVAAFPYLPAETRPATLPHFALYAYGRDYHKVVRQRLRALARAIEEASPGAVTRITVDTAPVAERYWARRAGVGIIGRNGQLIVDGCGSYCVLGEIITTAPDILLTETPVPPTAGAHISCAGCNRCVAACPAGALRGDGTLDARRCLSYLTIEHRGPLPPGAGRHGCLYGCDTCQSVCPHNRSAIPSAIADFAPRRGILELTADDCLTMTPDEFAERFYGTAVTRAGLEGLRRNAAAILADTSAT